MFQVDDDFNLPQVGLASFYVDSAEDSTARIVRFLQQGGRFLEIAELYSNHHLITKAILQCDLQREDVFISVKIWPQTQTPEELLERMQRFVHDSKLQYIDILMVHAPIDISNRFEQWKSLEEMKKQRLARALALTNLSLNQLMTFIKNADILPVIYMMEASPFHPQRDVVDYCNAGGIILLNNEPLCKGSRNRHPKIVEWSEKLGMTSEQLLFRWSVTKGFVTMIPPHAKQLGPFCSELTHPLPKEAVAELDLLEEELWTTWAPVVEEDS